MLSLQHSPINHSSGLLDNYYDRQYSEKAIIRVDVCQFVVFLLESSYSPVQSFPSTFCISEAQLSFMEEDSFCIRLPKKNTIP
eukprot:scaffold3740_cov302-Ochromonas_danica.AAC.2